MINLNTAALAASTLLGVLLTTILLNALQQVLLPRRKSEPPLVFHWIPFVGNAVAYGTDPLGFYQRCRARHGDVFTFVLLGRRMTVCLGADGNELVLNGRTQDVNAEDVYGPLTTPVFGSDVIYDCPNAKLMEQKRFVKFGLTQRALESYVPLIEREVLDYLDAHLKGDSGRLNVSAAMAEITIFTAGRALQGPEVRKKLTASFAELYHDLDMGFRPINFLMPWAPLPQNRRRDAAHLKMRSVYMDLINDRRRAREGKVAKDNNEEEEEPDMISNLMDCVYKDGQPLPDKEIANMMITLLMGGQHSSSYVPPLQFIMSIFQPTIDIPNSPFSFNPSSPSIHPPNLTKPLTTIPSHLRSASAWIMHRLASQPAIASELYEEQHLVIGPTTRPLTLTDLNALPLLSNIIKETLRVHSSIHSLMRRVTRPIAVPGTDYVITTDKVVVSSPIVSHMSATYFPHPETWDPHRWDAGRGLEARLSGSDEQRADDAVDYGYGATSKGTRSPYLPFGAGRHRCIGEKFAYLNLAAIVLTVVRNLKLATLDGSDAVPPTDYTSLFSRPVESAEIRWERRVPGVCVK